MTDILPIAVLVLTVVDLVILVVVLRKVSRADATGLASRLDAFEKGQERTERAVREEVAESREESAKAAREQRQELTGAFKTFGDSVVQRMADVAGMQKGQLDTFSSQLGSFAKASGERLDAARAETATAGKQLREEVVATLKSISETMTKTMRESADVQKAQLEAFSNQIASLTKSIGEKLDTTRAESAAGAKQLREEVISTLTEITEASTKTLAELSNVQKAQLEAMSSAIGKLSESNEKRLEAVRATVEGKLQSIQLDNARQLDQMRQTVDEKLQSTLDKRLGESFKLVSERLEQVHKGLGEMQNLASGVGDLRRVLTNVKARGTWGEFQLANLLEQVLTPDQYAANVATKPGSDERVEFAIRLPGPDDQVGEVVWLPIDAKFPKENYERLVDASEKADPGAVEAAVRQLELSIKGFAKVIQEKYLSPPSTTDFGIMFLPTEGLYAEVLRRPGLADSLQRDYRVVVTGPTTLAALLNSLQMGFRTLAITKRSSEVWKVLGAVKTEFGKFGDVLGSVKKRLDQASSTIDQASVRTRAIERKLRDIEELPTAYAKAMLPDVPEIASPKEE